MSSVHWYLFRKNGLVDFIPPIVLEENTTYPFKLESAMDIVKLTLQTTDKQIVKFRFEKTSDLIIYVPHLNGDYLYDEITNGYTYGALEGYHEFYLMSNDQMTGTVSIEIIDVVDVYSKDLSTMTPLPETYFNEPFYHGATLGDASFKLEVDDTLVYVFHLQNAEGILYKFNGSSWVYVRDINNESEVLLEPNTYKLILSSSRLKKSNVSYEKKELEYESSDITLNRFSIYKQ